MPVVKFDSEDRPLELSDPQASMKKIGHCPTEWGEVLFMGSLRVQVYAFVGNQQPKAASPRFEGQF